MAGLSLRAGDVFFTRSDTLLGRLVQVFQRDDGEDETVVNHVGLVVSDGLDDCVTLEALKTVRRATLSSWLPAHLAAGHSVWVFRPTFLQPAETEDVARYALETYPPGTKYGWWKLLGHALGYQKWFRLRKYPICSLLVGDAFEEATGFRFAGVPGLQVTPDDMWDAVISDPGAWRLVYEATGRG